MVFLFRIYCARLSLNGLFAGICLSESHLLFRSLEIASKVAAAVTAAAAAPA